MKLILSILFTLIFGDGYSQCGTPVVRELTYTNPGEWYRGDISAFNPGDTLKFMGESYSVIEFYGTSTGGTYSCPFVIVANTTLHADAIRFKGGAHNFKIVSTGVGNDTTTIRTISAKSVACDMADHIEFHGLKISGGDIGFYNKTNVSYENQNSWYPNFPMTANKLIGCWVSNINGEGIYSGLTQENGYTVTSTWSGLDTVIVGNRCDSTEIRDCYIDKTQWDGIQLAHSGYGNIISGNIVTNFGLAKQPSQKAGIVLGGDSNGDVYNNKVSNGEGNGIEIFGFGSVNIYNNTIDNVGNTTEHVDGEESIYTKYHTVTYISRPPLALYIHDNHIKNPKKRGAIKTVPNGNDIGSLVANNTFCIPDAQPNWQSTYLILGVPESTNTNNTLYCETSCNCTITNILKRVKYIN